MKNLKFLTSTKKTLQSQILIFLLLSSLFSIADTQIKMTDRIQVIMGTFCTISLESNRSYEIEDGFQKLKEIEMILSSYQKEALVYRLNRDKNISANPILSEILTQSKKYHTQTNGYFDITIGSITHALYRFGEEERIPTPQQKQKAVLNIDKIVLNKHNITIDKDIIIDLGGIGKGFAVDCVSEMYQKRGILNGKIALSGDIRCIGFCSVAVQDPFRDIGTIATLNAKIPNLSISTSGIYRRYIKSKSQHHLINPKTKSQGNAFVSVTIVAKGDNTLCDAMATAISVMPYEEALRFVHNQKQFGYFLITPQGEKISGNLEQFVTF